MSCEVVTLSCHDGRSFTGLLYTFDPETLLYYVLSAAPNDRFSMHIIPAREVHNCAKHAVDSVETVSWEDITIRLQQQANLCSRKATLLSKLHQSGEAFVDKGDKVEARSGSVVFNAPFGLEEDVQIDPVAKVEGEQLVTRLRMYDQVEEGLVAVVEEESELGDAVIVEDSKLLVRSEIDVPTYSPHSPSKEERLRVGKERNRRPSGVPKRYWDQRYRLFSRFHRGIRLDEESWYSVTPEPIAEHIAERCRCDVVVDLFCGAGGNAIQFAFTCERVIAVDIDPVKLSCAKHNAAIYQVQDRIEFVQADAIRLLETRAFAGIADVLFCSPPWGGPTYSSNDSFDLDQAFVPSSQRQVSFRRLIQLAYQTTKNVAVFLPRNTLATQCAAAGVDICEFEVQRVSKKTKTCTAYYGELCHDMAKASLD